jgi:uncharacterized protein (TIGR03084 family)
MAIFEDLEAEQDRLNGILAGLDEAQWNSPSAAAGWTVADVVLHLAQGDEAVLASAADADLRAGPAARSSIRAGSGATVDEIMNQLVLAERTTPAEVFSRWRQTQAAALAALRAADPKQPMAWVETPMKPASLATTRLAECWTHGLDITGPLGIDFPDTDRLRNVAWLAHRTLPYATAVAGVEPFGLFAELTAPDGTTTWRFGPEDADSSITGAAGAFCRMAAQRLAPEQSGLRAAGPHGGTALAILRTYAA